MIFIHITIGFFMSDNSFTPFYMERLKDESGISGKGLALWSVKTPDKKAIVQWQSEVSSIAIHNSIENFKKAHMEPHPGCNKLTILDKAKFTDDNICKLKRFYLNRKENPDFSSLTLGRIIEGVIFPDGQVVAQFCGPLFTTTFHKNLEAFKSIHIDKNPETNILIKID